MIFPWMLFVASLPLKRTKILLFLFYYFLLMYLWKSEKQLPLRALEARVVGEIY